MTENKKPKQNKKLKPKLKNKSDLKRVPKLKQKTNKNNSQAPKQQLTRGKDEFVKQNITALFLLVFGMVFLISITTNALGPLGLIIKSILLGQFAKVAIFISLACIFIGTARLVYNTKFDLKSISPVMLILLLLGSIIFYGAANASLVQAEGLNFELFRAVFVESIVGDNIGIIPYGITFFMVRIMKRLGMFITALTLFLFVGVYYFKITFEKLGSVTSIMAKEGGKLAKHVRTKTIDFVTIDENDKETGKKQKRKEEKKIEKQNRRPEKLDKTIIEGKFGYLERYKSDIEEFKDEFGYEEVEKEESATLSTDNIIKINSEEPKEEQQENLHENTQEPASENMQNEMPEEPEIHESRITNSLTKKFHGLSSMIERGLKEQPEDEIREKNEEAADQGEEKEALGNLEKEAIDQRELHKISEQEKENLINQNNRPASKIEIKPQKSQYILPEIAILNQYTAKENNMEAQINSAKKLESTLDIFGIEAKVVNISVGPTITRYELQPKMGVKVSKILNLSDDLALSLAAIAPIRIEAPIPGTSLVGIEVPNAKTEIVGFRSVLEAKDFKSPKKEIPVALGRDVSGKPVIEDIARMPHLLVAGSTGSGKSVCINTLICSILYKFKPEDIKMIMIDPKMVELSVYNNIPHLLIPVVTDMKKAPYALSWAVNEMNKRYKLFTESRVRDLKSYNELPGVEKLPRIVIIVDELADLMMVSPNEVEDSIIRLAQKARACGMHLVIATQRPSVDVITGLIKANIPSRIAFAVSSQVDSRTILDQAGAEKLIGKGDMLFSHPSIPKPQRIQGSFITDQEVNAVVEHILSQAVQTETIDIIEETIQNHIEEQKEEEKDPLLDEIIEFAIQNKQLSTSLIQRRFKVGYNRASRIIDTLEEMRVVSESDGAKPRRVIIESASDIQKKEE